MIPVVVHVRDVGSVVSNGEAARPQKGRTIQPAQELRWWSPAKRRAGQCSRSSRQFGRNRARGRGSAGSSGCGGPTCVDSGRLADYSVLGCSTIVIVPRSAISPPVKHLRFLVGENSCDGCSPPERVAGANDASPTPAQTGRARRFFPRKELQDNPHDIIPSQCQAGRHTVDETPGVQLHVSGMGVVGSWQPLQALARGCALNCGERQHVDCNHQGALASLRSAMFALCSSQADVPCESSHLALNNSDIVTISRVKTGLRQLWQHPLILGSPTRPNVGSDPSR